MKLKSSSNTDSEYPVHSSACLHVPHKGQHYIGGEIFGEFIITKSMFGEMCESVQF